MLVLASRSPRRAEILRAAGVPFVVRAADIHEERRDGESPIGYARRLAMDKAAAVATEPGDVVLGADTIVVVDDVVLEKPADADDARRMLGLLSGRGHEVITAICLRSRFRSVVDAAVTRVVFGPLSAAEIEAYVASGEPIDKAGAYAIQGLASKYIERIEGDYFNVVGLPVSLVFRHLKQFG
ncbi:MAG TPA: Maf family protein [Bryobacteraceae bacterium]|nr:Maf family protein [Bryobacteraceae bacterium]